MLSITTNQSMSKPIVWFYLPSVWDPLCTSISTHKGLEIQNDTSMKMDTPFYLIKLTKWLLKSSLTFSTSSSSSFAFIEGKNTNDNKNEQQSNMPQCTRAHSSHLWGNGAPESEYLGLYGIYKIIDVNRCWLQDLYVSSYAWVDFIIAIRGIIRITVT